MRLILLLLPLLWKGLGGGCVLFAQNGVNVSNLAVSTGSPTTVTFNVSWDKNDTNMPTLWSDTVWVFVDYNDAGVMKRLPVTDASVSAGTVTKIPGNDKGVWVAGDARTNDSFSATIQLFTEIKDVAGACAYASNYPPVGKYIGTNEIQFTGTAPYTVMLEGVPEPQTAGSYYIAPGTIASFTDKTGAPGIILGDPQPQGNCTYTEPAMVGTFANFKPENVGAATYVSLVDERDNKIYPVVKINNRWIMARNLNYQGTSGANTLTFQANSASPNKNTGSNTDLIGHFWCPGKNGATNSDRANCDVWGALYSWETAMMVDGKWKDDDRTSSSWTGATTSNSTDTGNTNNGGKGASSHGICPPNWHVPTDGEWGDLLNAMDDNTKNHNSKASVWLGGNAGTKAKSKCMCSTYDYCDTDNGPNAVNSWHGSGDDGTDIYGFRVLPSGMRNDLAGEFRHRGFYAHYWSSSAYTAGTAWLRIIGATVGTVGRPFYTRALGLSVRCIGD
jgi:uncharacterized protein (TIGR02145 family)